MISDDNLGDTVVAVLFGLDPAWTIRGLSISIYLERTHVDHRIAEGPDIRAFTDGLPYIMADVFMVDVSILASRSRYHPLDEFDDITPR